MSKYKIGDILDGPFGDQLEITSSTSDSYYVKNLRFQNYGIVSHQVADSWNLIKSSNAQTKKIDEWTYPKIGDIVVYKLDKRFKMKALSNPDVDGTIHFEVIETYGEYASVGAKVYSNKIDVMYHYEILKQEVSKTNTSCTCSSRDLFVKGCQCGAVQPFKSKWG